MNTGIPDVHFLCICIPPQFLASLLTDSESYSISLDSSYHLSESYEKISAFNYEVYLIDGSIAQEELSNLIDWIFKNNKKKITIALLEDPATMGKFKELEDRIDYFLQKTNFSRKIDHFLLEIAGQPALHAEPFFKDAQVPYTLPERPARQAYYIIDDEDPFLDLLDRVKEQFPVDIHFESHPDEAIKKIKSVNFFPDAILISQKFFNEESDTTAFDIMKSQSSLHKSGSPLLILLLDEEDYDIRLKAIQKGFDYVLAKPIAAFSLFKTVHGLLESRKLKEFRALILDEDEQFCNFVMQALHEIHGKSKTTSDIKEFFNLLEDFRPDIIFLSPDFENSNLDLLKVIRQDGQLQNLIVVIATPRESYLELNAYLSQIDAIFNKPIEWTFFQNRVLNLLKAQKRATHLPLTYDYTGFNHRNQLLGKLQKWLMDPKKHDSYLVLFEIDRFTDWEKRKGKGSAAKDLLVKISNHLQQEMDYPMNCFFYEGSRFALLMADSNLDEIEKYIYQFLYRFTKAEAESQLSFNCCLIPISVDFDAQSLLKEAEKELVKASQIKEGPIRMIDWLAKEKNKNKTTVFLADPDPAISKALSTAFDSHGIIVRGFREGELLLKELEALSEKQPPSLVIIERKLPDMDGMDLFKKIKYRYHARIPCFILTIFSSDKDVSDGINHGVSEYFIKPFNFTLFIQKALKAIYSHK
ncbi:MAG: response regulator [Parachlamydia sp.]|nr:response regulator [Parachlamydia sp.]